MRMVKTTSRLWFITTWTKSLNQWSKRQSSPVKNFKINSSSIEQSWTSSTSKCLSISHLSSYRYPSNKCIVMHRIFRTHTMERELFCRSSPTKTLSITSSRRTIRRNWLRPIQFQLLRLGWKRIWWRPFQWPSRSMIFRISLIIRSGVSLSSIFICLRIDN